MLFGSYTFCLHYVLLFFPTTIHNSNADALKSLAVQSLRNLEATRVMNRDEVAQELQEHEIYHQSPGTVAAGVGSVMHNVGGAHGVSGVSGVSGGGVSGVRGTASAPQRSASPPTTSTTSGSGGNGGTSPRRGTIVSSNAALWDVDNGSEDDI